MVDLGGQICCALTLFFFAASCWWQAVTYVRAEESSIPLNKVRTWSLELGILGRSLLRVVVFPVVLELPWWESAAAVEAPVSFNKAPFGGSTLLSGGALLFSFSRRGGVRRKKQAGLRLCDVELLRSWGTAKSRGTISAGVVCQPTQMASRWLVLTPVSIPGVLSTSMERPSSEFAVALHVESETSGLVPVSGAGGCSRSSSFIGGCRGGLDGFFQSSCRVFCAKFWDCFVIFIFLLVPLVLCSCTALI